MKSVFKAICLGLLGLMLTACSTTYTVQIHPSISVPESTKQIALFLDGTQNDRDSRTNVSTLSEIVKHQYKDNLYIFYNEGVGTDGRFVGAGAGWGIDKDVAEAYSFLSKYYSPGSKVYVFGFSRGAYTSRILAGMIYAIGVYDLSSFTEKQRLKISKELYDIYKGKNKEVNSIRQAGKEIVGKWGGLNPQHAIIEVMGLWDTVEALGAVPTLEALEGKVLGIKDPQNIVNPNGRYVDQICNAKNIFHALSLDDNRANVFTPIIITSDHVAEQCNPDNPKEATIDKIEEVWFSGAHSDVGGGYSMHENTKKGVETDRDVSLSGVSLNWMMSRIKNVAPELLPVHARVFQNPLGYMHDAENDSSMYKRTPRHNILTKYSEFSRYDKLKIHSSVFKRLSQPARLRKTLGYDSEWYKLDAFSKCFLVGDNGEYNFRECSLIQEVK